MLTQFKLVTTGVVFQLVLKQRLSARQWGALVIIMAGCVLKELPNLLAANASSPDSPSSYLLLRLGPLLGQILCSTFAGVYCEMLLKQHPAPTSVQNFYMYCMLCCEHCTSTPLPSPPLPSPPLPSPRYFVSIIASAVAICADTGAASLLDRASGHGLRALLFSSSSRVLLIVMTAAAMGVWTSLFLRYLDSVLKVRPTCIQPETATWCTHARSCSITRPFCSQYSTLPRSKRCSGANDAVSAVLCFGSTGSCEAVAHAAGGAAVCSTVRSATVRSPRARAAAPRCCPRWCPRSPSPALTLTHPNPNTP